MPLNYPLKVDATVELLLHVEGGVMVIWSPRVANHQACLIMLGDLLYRLETCHQVYHITGDLVALSICCVEYIDIAWKQNVMTCAFSNRQHVIITSYNYNYNYSVHCSSIELIN